MRVIVEATPTSRAVNFSSVPTPEITTLTVLSGVCADSASRPVPEKSYRTVPTGGSQVTDSAAPVAVNSVPRPT